MAAKTEHKRKHQAAKQRRIALLEPGARVALNEALLQQLEAGHAKQVLERLKEARKAGADPS